MSRSTAARRGRGFPIAVVLVLFILLVIILLEWEYAVELRRSTIVPVINPWAYPWMGYGYGWVQ